MLRALTLLAVGAVALAGCGGDDDGGGGGGAVTVPADAPIEVSADEYKFSPESIVVEGGGGPLKVTLRNDGATAHDLRVQHDGEDVGGTPIFGPDQSKTATVALKPGKYEFICSVGDHEALGMKGTLEVK
jgi:plastocyanin